MDRLLAVLLQHLQRAGRGESRAYALDLREGPTLGAVFGLFSGIYFWWPKVFGRMLSERLRVLEAEGIPVQTYAVEAHRPNLVARLKGTGKKRPILLMGHTDTVNVDAKKWSFPPFSAQRDGGFIYGRGTIDDKDNLSAALMTVLLLKRQNVALDRDVILLAESGEEGSSQLGIGHMIAEHYPEIDAEYALAEGGSAVARKVVETLTARRALMSKIIVVDEDVDPVGREVLDRIIENAAIAAQEKIPLCQDTGSILFFVKAPKDFDQLAFEKAAREAVDRRLLAQALSNLLENTLRHTPAGTAAKLSAKVSHDAIEVTLEDNGPGVPPVDAKRLFQRFARAEASRTTDGHGLGLALVRAIAVGHGGDALLSRSERAFGVTIRLPR